jgi:hypothetical protein
VKKTLAAFVLGFVTLALPATDAFTRTDADNLGANWTNWAGDTSTSAGRFSVVSNEASSGSNMTFGGSYWNADSFNNNQSSEATVSTAPSGTGYHGVMVRATGSTSLDFNGYGFLCNDSLGRIEEFNNSVDTPSTLQGSLSTCADGDVIKITVEGTTIKAFVNGVQTGSNQTDATLASGSAGIYAYSTGTGNSQFTTWTGDNVAAAGGSFIPAIINNPIRGGVTVIWGPRVR